MTYSLHGSNFRVGSVSVISGPATISGNTVTLTGVGSVTLEADQAGTPEYARATRQVTFKVN